MRKSIKSTLSAALLPAIFLSFIVSCSEDSKELVPDTAPDIQQEEVSRLATAPDITEAPASGEVREEIANLRFPESKKKSTNAKATAAGVTDYVDFNDQMALTIIPDNAQNTFTFWPFYIHKVGNAWIHVKENNGAGYNPAFTSNYNHYHLSYQNFNPCITGSGEFGKPSGNSCLNINPILEPRKLDTHHGSQWIKIYAYDYSSSQRTFDLLGIKVTNGPIQLWFKKKGGGWWKWSSLGTGTWNLSAYSTEITQVLIGGTSSSSFGFDNVKVKVPYN
ncbi:hypothetical protein OKW21_003979 [Catalinimonas alkaloidigena]|uniref:hypothetical protein n=1 Tax=Catalinimonas alkaloidigena TaxID=1075417 RepID=UPI0024054183|nr:hypothetical protein [Catalinimonas alkaloidigena]MDF9798716.1 hypothetical protein [Catalinimonas alkaloidigena]